MVFSNKKKKRKTNKNKNNLINKHNSYKVDYTNLRYDKSILPIEKLRLIYSIPNTIKNKHVYKYINEIIKDKDKEIKSKQYNINKSELKKETEYHLNEMPPGKLRSKNSVPSFMEESNSKKNENNYYKDKLNSIKNFIYNNFQYGKKRCRENDFITNYNKKKLNDNKDNN